jgi:hypothetical protein
MSLPTRHYISDTWRPSLSPSRRRSYVLARDPTRAYTDCTSVVWIQKSIWLAEEYDKQRRIRSIPVRIVAVLPSNDCPGTIITHFAAPMLQVSAVSNALIDAVLVDHALGRGILSSLWVTTFAFLGAIAVQMDHTFGALDPASISDQVKQHPSRTRSSSDSAYRFAVCQT